MTRAEKIDVAKRHVLRAVDKIRMDTEGDVEAELILRFALYVVAQQVLDGHVREIAFTHPPFPEEEDHE